MQEKVALRIDSTETNKTIQDLVILLESRFPQGIPERVVNCLLDFDFRFSLSEGRSTIGADGTIDIIQRIHLLDSVESLAAAVLASECNFAHG